MRTQRVEGVSTEVVQPFVWVAQSLITILRITKHQKSVTAMSLALINRE